MKRLTIIACFAAGAATAQTGHGAGAPTYKDPRAPIQDRVRDLLQRMTTDEKIRQLDMYWGHQVADMDGHEASAYNEEKVKTSIGVHGIGSIHDFYPLSASLANKIQRYAMERTRLGIPVLFIEEGLHGYSGKGSTEFPIPLELSSAWDTALVRQAGRTIATETRAHGVDMILGPVLDMARDPRWGRTEETYGEDAYLNSRNGVAMVEGLQGLGLGHADAVIAEPKHFAVHSVPEGGSNTAPVNMGEREARSSFLYVFEKAVREGGAMGIMAAYHEWDGIPCVDNRWLLTDVLRKEWGFKGFVLSDLGAIKMTLTDHHVAADTADALGQSIAAGLDMQFYDFAHETLVEAVKTALQRHTLTAQDLDRAAGDILRVKFTLGLFDHPYTDTAILEKLHTNDDLALQAAREGVVLLKNEGNILPLQAAQKIAVIGPLATSQYIGGYSSPSAHGISILQALKDQGANVTYAEGYTSAENYKSDTTGYPGEDEDRQKAVQLTQSSDKTLVVLGEEPWQIGEGKDRAELNLSPRAESLIKALYATGKPIVVVLSNGRPLTIDWVAAHIPGILETWFAGQKGGLAIADILLGKVNPSGKLPITFPRSVGQLPLYEARKFTSYHRYVDEADSALFPFGQGLSYTTFAYKNLKITPTGVTVDITNTGAEPGAEVAQLYIHDVVGSVTTPNKALRGFVRINLDPGETKTVRFPLGPDQLSLWNRQMKRVVEPGEFRIMVGSSSRDIRLEGSLWVKK
ncbi:MAG TPA: glycoside hydrolase family 3 N-terminal domain-containing protein [Dinghuibacter sp.]|uniref:glycoside hydrolase family 3 N-terminal domain-containing protein n=1 Tax=Dinghuibacter sp. TaxID=2024697 RepID=UPI002C420259|nr:glycoside hydrolase family 3 N-terminal domain-containing protein [Dinghuibacter sp.]HTJ14900.1 glycoside hydrolase family 3 N-terminal domain-containing protein [Dinghuibacter sp.]